MVKKQNLILIGMPGAGKSTIGVLLAKRLGVSFLDTDILMQTGEGCHLQETIAEHGLDGFRSIEERYLLSDPVKAEAETLELDPLCANIISKLNEP